MELTFQYPLWYIGLCVLLGITIAGLLYIKAKPFGGKSTGLNIFLSILRGLAVAGIAILLLSPLLKKMQTETRKPIVVIATDVSESMSAALNQTDSATLTSGIANLATTLKEQYDVIEYTFGSELKESNDINFSDKVTDMATVIDEVYDLYGNQNLGALVLSSDGIYNQGSNPLYLAPKLGAPIFTIAVGDTTPKRDLVLKRVFHNNIAYLGDKFSIQVDVSAYNCAGAGTTLRVSKVGDGGQVLDSQPISLSGKDFFTTKEIILSADKPGTQRFRISLTGVSGEASRANNTKDIFVEVLDARQQILIAATAAHPDLTAIKASYDGNKNYEVTLKIGNDIPRTVSKYDVVILHQLPSTAHPATDLLNDLRTGKVPHMFVLGAQTNVNAFDKVQDLITLKGANVNVNDVQPVMASGFNLFTISDELIAMTKRFPPLQSPFGEYSPGGNTDILLEQKIGTVETGYPLMVFGELDGIKQAVICGEGIYKWRIFNYLQQQHFDQVDELLGKTLQYLSVKRDKRRFRATASKTLYDENEHVFIDAELYNESYELINEPDATVTLSDQDGKQFPFTMSKTSSAYTLDAGILPTGSYRYTASVSVDGNKLTSNGRFSIKPIQLELFETTADYGLLRLMSERTGGEQRTLDGLNTLAERISGDDAVRPTLYSTLKTRAVINLKWIFFALIGLLIIEWFIRRYKGAY